MTAVKSPRQLLIGPAIGLVVAGILACLTPLLPLFGVSVDVPVLRTEWQPLLSLLWFLGPILGIPILWGVYLMLRLESYWYARLTCVLAMIPGSLGVLVGLPAGIWGLRILCRPEVREAFEQRAAAYRFELEQALEEYDADLREP
jgi:hypothetical protein